jgi:hypothetical protein
MLLLTRNYVFSSAKSSEEDKDCADNSIVEPAALLLRINFPVLQN